MHKNSTGTFTKPKLAKPRSVSSNSSSRSSSSYRWIPKRLKSKKNFSKSLVNFSKPNYKWVPKNSSVLSPQSPLHASGNQSDLKNQKANFVNKTGKPSVSMVWVPKSN